MIYRILLDETKISNRHGNIIFIFVKLSAAGRMCEVRGEIKNPTRNQQHKSKQAGAEK